LSNLERIGEATFSTYEQAARRKDTTSAVPGVVKTKIFARNDGTFNVVWYGKVKSDVIVPTKNVLKINVGYLEPGKKTEDFIKKVKSDIHGKKSKDRKVNSKNRNKR
jgi:hypothetical protein